MGREGGDAAERSGITSVSAWRLVVAEIHARAAFALPLQPRALARAAGVRLYALPQHATCDALVQPHRAFYRTSRDPRVAGLAIAGALADVLILRLGFEEHRRDGLITELLAPAWALTQTTVDAALADLPWTPEAMVLRRWAERRSAAGM